MSQEEISQLFKVKYPQFVGYKEIMIVIGISKRSVLNNLEKMRNRNEIEYIIKQIGRQWIRLYREKREDLNKEHSLLEQTR